MLLRVLLVAALTACSGGESALASEGTVAAPPLAEGQAEAIFAGGCFWCMEKPFDQSELDALQPGLYNYLQSLHDRGMIELETRQGQHVYPVWFYHVHF